MVWWCICRGVVFGVLCGCCVWCIIGVGMWCIVRCMVIGMSSLVSCVCLMMVLVVCILW